MTTSKGSILGNIVGIVGIAFIVGVVFAILPVEFSAYTLAEFHADLDSLGLVLTTSLGAFSAIVDVVFLLLVVKIIFGMVVSGVVIKLAIIVYNLFNKA